MKSILLVCGSLLLAGCIDVPSDAVPAEDGPESATAPEDEAPSVPAAGPTPLVEGTATWHSIDTGNAFRAALDVAYVAGHVLVHSCLSDGEPWLGNLHLSKQLNHGSIPQGTRAMEILLEWSDEDYLGEGLVLIYRARDGAWHESPIIAAGAPVVLETPPETWSADPRGLDGLDLWLCLQPSEASTLDEPWGPEPFVGDVAVKIDLLPVQD